MDGKQGQLNTTGSVVRFYYPELTGIQIDGLNVMPVDAGEGWISLQLEPGYHDFRLLSGAGLPKTENDCQRTRSNL